MKNLLACGIFAFLMLLTGCTDKPVLPAQLPMPITSFIQQNFPGQTISFAQKDLEITGWQYDVVLADGTQIEFDTDQEYIDQPCSHSIDPRTDRSTNSGPIPASHDTQD